MPKVIDEKVRARAVRLVQEHRGEYPTLSKALEAVARQEGVGKESLGMRSSRSAGSCGSRAARSPHEPTGPGPNPSSASDCSVTPKLPMRSSRSCGAMRTCRTRRVGG